MTKQKQKNKTKGKERHLAAILDISKTSLSPGIELLIVGLKNIKIFKNTYYVDVFRLCRDSNQSLPTKL